MKTLQITILCAVLALVGGCSRVDAKTSAAEPLAVEPTVQPTGSLTAFATATVDIHETELSPELLSTNTPTPPPTVTETRIVTSFACAGRDRHCHLLQQPSLKHRRLTCWRRCGRSTCAPDLVQSTQ